MRPTIQPCHIFCVASASSLATNGLLIISLPDAALLHAGARARISFRRKAFTFFDVGKALATSGSNTTTLAPSA